MDLNKLKVTVVGCGWLGLPLCETLMTKGHKIITTTSTEEKRLRLSSQFSIHQFTIHQFDIISHPPLKEIFDSDVIIYTIPPLGFNEIEYFFKNIDPEKRIIFISSVSVYGKSEGPCNEESPINPESKNGKGLAIAENFLRTRFKNVTILRLGGLYGENRHPIFSLQGKSGLRNGEEYVHLVHQKDCINAIITVIEKTINGETLNIISDLKIRKKLYYTQMAERLQLPVPKYEKRRCPHPIQISNIKSKKMLGLYSYYE